MKSQNYILAILISITFSCSDKDVVNSVSTIDIVRGNLNYDDEIMFYYKENWLKFREEAIKKGAISGYNLLRTPVDSVGNFTLILLTEYPDSLHFRESEENFQPIMQDLRPDGPEFLNEVEKKQFVEYLIGFEASSLFQEN